MFKTTLNQVYCTKKKKHLVKGKVQSFIIYITPSYYTLRNKDAKLTALLDTRQKKIKTGRGKRKPTKRKRGRTEKKKTHYITLHLHTKSGSKSLKKF